jgi:kumamolisin
MIKTFLFSRTSYFQAIVASLTLATVGIHRAHAQDEEMVDPSNPAVAAEVLQVANAQDLGRRAGSLPMEVVLTLRFNHPDELHQLIREQSDPTSSNYHQYLTVAQFAEKFGPTEDQLNRVVTELQKNGFQVTSTSSNRLLVHATSTTAIVENFFHTEIHKVRQDTDSERYMNVKPALLPDVLIPLVKAVHVDNLIVAKVGLRADSISGPIRGPANGGLTGGFTPVALADSFDFPVQHGFDGTGHTAAIIIDSDVTDSDLNTFFAFFPIARTGTITRESVDGGLVGSTNADVDETALDTETIGGLAPGANIILYIIPSLSITAINDAANKIVLDDTAEVVNMSFGGSEFKDATFETALTTGSAEGITFVASSGDNGSNGGVVSWPAVEPQVLGLGGTVIRRTSTGWVHKRAWSGSGGGVSQIFSIPAYQVGVSGLASTTRRNVPDVGFPAYYTDTYVDGAWVNLEGTSWSSPTYVALQIEVNQVQNSRFGSVNTAVYNLFKSSGYNNFFDVTRGTNGQYNAKVGYDNVSGIGSPQGYTYAQKL